MLLKNQCLLFTTWLSLLYVTLSQEINFPIVEVPGQGLVKGIVMHTINEREIHGFLGIPYSKPPVRDLRFKEPQSPEPFDGIWDGTHFRDHCLQYRHLHPPGQDKVFGHEDCLYINVYTPKIHQNYDYPPMDVLVNIHGGAFMFGTGDHYGPKYLLDKDVILVTFNYRLGPLGFLSFEDDVMPGNIGMKDQVAALQWVKDNIIAFGGNPDSINLIGLSAGGASVHYHYLSPLSKGLFKTGISVSGTALCPWALVEKPREKALKLASILGCSNNNDSSVLLKCFLQRPATDIVSAMSHFQPWLYNPFSPFGPVVEPKNMKGSPFLSDDPFHLLSNGKFQHKPWISGVTTHEGLYPASDWITDENLMREFNQHFDVLAPHILHFTDTVDPENMKKVVNKIRKFYFGDGEIGIPHKEEVIKICSDRLFLYASSKASKLQSKYSPVYQYEFSYRGSHSLSEAFTGTDEDLGVSHGDDIAYVLNLDFIGDFNDSDRPMSEMMINLFTSFMKNERPQTQGVSWKQVNPDMDLLNYLSIASPTDTKMISTSDFGNCAFWDSLKLMEHHHSQTTRDEL